MKYLKSINEFVSSTIPVENVVRQLQRRFSDKVLHSYIYENNIRIEYINSDTIDEINKFMSAMGWYPSYIIDYMKYSKEAFLRHFTFDDYTIVMYEKKYDDNVVVDGYIYHVAPDIYIDKIKEKGLITKSKNKISTHPDRIYFFKERENWEDVADILMYRLPEDIKKLVKGYYLIRVDTEKLNNVKFYKDPNFELNGGGIFTYNNITPDEFDVVDRVLEDEGEVEYDEDFYNSLKIDK